MHKTRNGFGGRVKEARRAANLTQQQLAAKSRVSQALISKIERGEHERSAYLLPIATALGVSPYWLENGKEEKSNAA